MKYVIALLLGISVGVIICIAGIVYNPFSSSAKLSPLSVTDAKTITLTYDAFPESSMVFTNNGESRIAPVPDKVLELWEAPIRDTEAMATLLYGARGQTAGIGIKFSSLSESTRLLDGKANMDSVWYVYLPGQGGLFIEQTENYFAFLKSVVVPGYRSSANSWKGNWLGDTTIGPKPLGTAAVFGGSGQYAGTEMLGLESLTVSAWSAESGPIAAQGRLTIEMPEALLEDEPEVESTEPDL